MRVSVVIPAFNEEKFIRRSLESLITQTQPADEILVVDNNSTDQTGAIAREFPVRVVTEDTRGIIPARNRGFDEAHYEIIARTDADTLVPPDWVEKIRKKFIKSRCIGISGPSSFGSEMLVPLVSFIVFTMNRKILGHISLYGPNMAIRQDAWKTVRHEVCSNEEDIHEDLDLAIHLARYGTLLFTPDIVVKTSARRVKNPSSFFIDYNYKWYNTIAEHKEWKEILLSQM